MTSHSTPLGQSPAPMLSRSDGMHLVPFSNKSSPASLFDSFLNYCIDESPDISSNKSIEQCIQCYNRFIQEKLRAFERVELKRQRSGEPSLESRGSLYTSENFESKIRQKLTDRLISRQAEIFQRQFQQTGTITFEEMIKADNAILCFGTTHQTPMICVSPFPRLICDTFNVRDPDSFAELRGAIHSKTEHWLQQAAMRNSKRASKRKEYAAHSERQLATIAWAEKLCFAIQETTEEILQQYQMNDEDCELLFNKAKQTDV